MSTIFSPEHINAHQALLQFLSINPVQQYDVSTKTWHAVDDIFSATLTTPVLTISAQHLNAYLVQSILAQLPSNVSNVAIRLHPLSDAFSASVIQVVLNKAVDKAWLAAIATQYYVDVFCITDAPRLADPGVIVMDMDSTVIQIECIDEIAKLCGKGDEVSAVTELAMEGKLDFTQSLRQRVSVLDGIEVNLLKGIRDSIPLMPGIHALLQTLQGNGWKTVIASGGFTFFAHYLQSRLALDGAHANELEVIDGRLTGRVLGDIVDAQVKAQTVLNYAQHFDIPLSQTIALGDGANDLVMMGQAGLGMAFHAKPVVEAQADAAIRFGGLEQTLYALV